MTFGSHVIRVNGVHAQVFECAAVPNRQVDSETVSPNGSEIGTAMITSVVLARTVPIEPSAALAGAAAPAPPCDFGDTGHRHGFDSLLREILVGQLVQGERLLHLPKDANAHVLRCSPCDALGSEGFLPSLFCSPPSGGFALLFSWSLIVYFSRIVIRFGPRVHLTRLGQATRRHCISFLLLYHGFSISSTIRTAKLFAATFEA